MAAKTNLNQPQFQSAEKAREYLERIRWNGKPICPHCGVVDGHYALTGESTRPGLWNARDCRGQFTGTAGTGFEGSKIALNVGRQRAWLSWASKQGVSTKQLEWSSAVSGNAA